MASSSRILVVGSNQVGKQEIVESLARLCGEKIDKKGLVPAFHLRTKYYTAPIEFHVHKVFNNEPLQELQYALEEYEAMLCIVDVNEQESFLHVSKFVEKILEQHQFEVSLLVGNLVTDDAPKQLQDLQEWCQELAFEFVQVPHRSFMMKQEEETFMKDENDNEKIGMERILEALQCNMWHSMEMLSGNNQVTSSLTTTQAAAKEEALKENKQQDTKACTDKPQDNQQEEEQEADERLQTLLAALQVTDNQKDEEKDEKEEEEDGDVDFHEFANLVNQVRRIRDQGQTLSDEERRRQAADMAMRLWNFLGVDEEEKEGEQNNYHSSDEE